MITLGDVFGTHQERVEAMLPPADMFARFIGELNDKKAAHVMRRLTAPKGYWGLEYVLNKHAVADYQDCDPVLMRFIGKFIAKMRKDGVPLWVPYAGSDRVHLAHVRFGTSLTKYERQVIQKLGDQQAFRLNLPIQGEDGLTWFNPRCFKPVSRKEGDPVRLSPVQISNIYR